MGDTAIAGAINIQYKDGPSVYGDADSEILTVTYKERSIAVNPGEAAVFDTAGLIAPSVTSVIIPTPPPYIPYTGQDYDRTQYVLDPFTSGGVLIPITDKHVSYTPVYNYHRPFDRFTVSNDTAGGVRKWSAVYKIDEVEQPSSAGESSVTESTSADLGNGRKISAAANETTISVTYKDKTALIYPGQTVQIIKYQDEANSKSDSVTLGKTLAPGEEIEGWIAAVFNNSTTTERKWSYTMGDSTVDRADTDFSSTITADYGHGLILTMNADDPNITVTYEDQTFLVYPGAYMRVTNL